jgi:uncharacterized protein YndB with AHSA1/START domain
MGQVTVERSIGIAAPRQRVWEALTNPAEVIQRFVPNLAFAQMTRDDSGTVRVHIGEMGVEFITLDLVELLRVATYRSLPDRLIAAHFTLADEHDGTLVTVTVDGFYALLSEAGEDRLAQGGTGWEKALDNLNAFVGGAALPFPQAYVGPLFGYWREPKKRLAVERSIWIAAPRERVWRATTEPKQMQQWFSPSTPWELSTLAVGGRYYVQNTETGVEMYVEFIELVEPPHQLATRTTPEPPDTVVKHKTYTLTEENGGTRFTITLTGYEQEPADSRWNRMEENAFGFGMMLQNTKAFAEGKSLPFPGGFQHGDVHDFPVGRRGMTC